jgi:pSer/pThr/pTyr-binding forkhead associated (FHA) protein
MIEQVLLLLQAVFLAFLFLFIWMVVRSGRRDLRLAQESFVLAPAQARRAGFDAAPRAQVVIESSPSLEPGRAFEIRASGLTLGRSGDNEIALPADEFASARHARIEPQVDGVWIVDLGSTNGTYVNGQEVDGREQLHDGDVVRVGDTELRVAG